MKLFPIMLKGGGPKGYIPFEFMLRYEKQADINHCGQSIETLASRGGLSAVEAMAAIEGQRFWPWDNLKYKEHDPAWEALKALILAEYPDWNFIGKKS